MLKHDNNTKSSNSDLSQQANEIRYVVSLTQTAWGWAQHLKLWRDDGKEIVVSWDVIQLIKNEALGIDICAVEFYPEESDVVNEVNYRHLWAIPFRPPLTRS